MTIQTTTTQQIAETKDERQAEPADDLITVFDRVARRQPDETAVISLHQKDHLGVGSLRWTYSQLRDGSIRLAQRLVAAGVRRGSRIATFLFNEIEWSILFLASARVGCHFVPLDPRVLNQRSDAVYILRKVWAESIFVSNLALARVVENILETELMPQIRVKGVVSPTAAGQDDEDIPHRWLTLAQLMAGPPPVPTATSSKASLKRDDTILMLCTSGTTSRPKICPHTSVTIVTPALGLADHWSLTREHTLCQHLPSFHIFSVALTLAFWVSGGTVVFPSPEFDPAASFEGLAAGSRVYTACVPAMVYAMHTYSMTTDEKLASPVGICLGGAPITPDVLRTCKALGAQRIIAGYGTTEGVATLFNTMAADDPRITKAQDGDDVCLGTAVAGSHLRICAPDSRRPLRRGEIGELHQGGYPVFAGYFEGSEEDNSTCYHEGVVPWFATGDRGYMDDEGNIYLLGRYKDLIIRGGENISPLKIEQCLYSQLGVTSAVVVGAPDDIVGEVPVAVIETRDNKRDKTYFSQLQAAVVRALGRPFAPKLILHLQNDLGREKYPTTTSGKIKKTVVKEWVAAYLGESTSQNPILSKPGIPPELRRETGKIPSADSAPGIDIAAELTACWSDISGVDAAEIKPETPIRTFTDSTMLIQFLDCAKKRGWRLSLKDLVAANTVQKQAQLLLKKGVPQSHRTAPQTTTTANIVDTQKERVALRLGVAAADIEELVPMTDMYQFMAVNRPFPGAWDFRVPFLVRQSLSTDQVAAAVEIWLGRHELLRSMVADIDNEPPVYAVMYPRPHWLKHQIIRGPRVNDLEAVRNYRMEDYLDSCAGPHCKVIILPIRETSRSGLVLHIHHAIFDGLVLERWLQDLNHLLEGKPRLTWQPYRHFASAYNTYRSSPAADESVEFFVRRLSGISAAKHALLQPGSLNGAEDHMEYFSQLGQKGIIGPGHAGYTRTLLSSSVRLARLPEMRSSFGISAPIIALAACALVNVRHTGAREAIFLNLQSGRSWPLEDDDDASHMPSSPMEIGGPTMTNPTTRIPIIPDQTALDVLTRLRAEQDEMMVHAHAPIARVFERLAQREGGAADIAMIRDMFHGQLFDWLLEPFTVKPEDILELIGMTQLSPTVWAWMPRLDDGDVLHMDLIHQYPDLAEWKARGLLHEFLCAAAWLADPENAYRPVSQCRYDSYELRTEQ